MLSTPDTGRFRNFMSYDRRWQEIIGSQDSHGRALWALGVVTGWGQNSGQVAVATRLFKDALPALKNFSDSRAIAFPILGMQAYLRRYEDDHEVRELAGSLGERLRNRFREFATDDWRWHEETLTYDNARLAEALMASGRISDDRDLVKLGLDVLEWLRDIQIDPSGGWFTPVGNKGWYPKSGKKSTIRSATAGSGGNDRRLH